MIKDMPSKKKKYNARFPPARIKKIMQTDDEVGKVAAPVPVIISRALELFVEALVKKTSEITQARNAKTLTTSHLKACILGDTHFNFLNELVATVPDVQGEDEGANPLPNLDPTQQVVSIRPKNNRGRKPKNRNGESHAAGPSHSTAEESESVDDDEDEEEEEDDESECGSSETTCDNLSMDLSTVPQDLSAPFTQQQNNTAAITLALNNNSVEDDDYDS